jgi:hypothetical protein
MSVVETTEDTTVAQLQQQYDSVSREISECKAVLNDTNELILQLEKEKEALMIKSKKREEEEEEEWARFQEQYDDALKEKQKCEIVFNATDQVVLHLENETEKLMELTTNKETEVQMAQWQQRYDTAIKEKDEAEFHLHKEKERLSELREIQSAYLKKREEEDAAMWETFHVRYDAALEGKKDCEMELKSKEEEMMRLHDEKKKKMMVVAEEKLMKEEDTKSLGDSLLSPVVVSSSPQSHDEEDGEQQQQHVGSGGTGGEGGDVSLITDPSATMSNSAITEIHNPNNHYPGGIDGTKEGREVSTITESQQDETHRNHMMAYGDDNDDDDTTTSLGATTIASSVSRAMEYKKDLSALDKFLSPPAKDESSVVSGRSNKSMSGRSMSSRSVRRRDVIKPMDLLDEKSNHTSKTTTITPAKQEGMIVAKIDDTPDQKPLSPWALSNHGDDEEVNRNEIVEQQSNPQCDEQQQQQQLALVVHNPKQRTPRPTNLEPEEGRAALLLGNDPPGESPTERPYIDPNDDAIYDSSSVSYIGGGGGRFRRNVQWVDPKNVHDEDIDFGILKAYERMTCRGVTNDQSSPDNSLKKQQQMQRMMDPPEDLPRNNYYPEEDDSSSSTKARLTKASLLRDNRRIRIATISSGYKTANYFVREDLDTRIYFHELEDAINYMSRRGYARMKKEDEREWIKLLVRAHGVVKVNKGGIIVLVSVFVIVYYVLFSNIEFCPLQIKTGPTKKKQRYRKGKLVIILSKEINDNDDDEYKKAQYCDSSETDRTSLGRSVRCGFKSYSEKFLAEQEAAKRNTLLQLGNGADVDRVGHLLQLTNGEVMSVVDEGTLESSKAKDSMGSDRKGVYGGGVRYFTSDNNDDESEDHSSHEDRSEEENESEEGLDEENDENESDVYQESGDDEEEEQEEMHEVEGSMGSMFSDEDSFRDDRSAGVDSISASSTLTSGYPTPLQRKGTYREPPQGLALVSDESLVS